MNHLKHRHCYTIAFKRAVKTEIVFKSFKKCGISNSLDGTEDNLLFQDSDDSVPDSEELSNLSSSEDDDFCGFWDED
jgi:hypothetical protein